MTTQKKPRPVAPKALSKSLRVWLEACVEGRAEPKDFSERDARAILAALKHERHDEREACALIADKEAEEWVGFKGAGVATSTIARRIRNRGKS